MAPRKETTISRRDNPTQRLRQAGVDLSRAINIIASRLHTLDLLADPLVAVDYDGMRAEGLSDPTPRHAQQLAHWHALQHDIGLHVQLICSETGLLVQALSNVPTDIDTKAIARLHRCSDPTCDQLADKAGMCAAHYMQQYRASRKVDER